MFRFCSFSKPSIRDWKNSLLKFCKWNWPILGSLVHAVSQTNRKVHRNRKTNKSKGLLQSPPTFLIPPKLLVVFFFGFSFSQRSTVKCGRTIKNSWIRRQIGQQAGQLRTCNLLVQVTLKICAGKEEALSSLNIYGAPGIILFWQRNVCKFHRSSMAADEQATIKAVAFPSCLI